MPIEVTKRPAEIAIPGEFNSDFPPRRATNCVIKHSREQLGVELHSTWVSTADIHVQSLWRYAGIWVAPGSPHPLVAAFLKSTAEKAKASTVPVRHTRWETETRGEDHARSRSEAI
jgi:hypothetical protein